MSYKSAVNLEDPFHLLMVYREELGPRPQAWHLSCTDRLQCLWLCWWKQSISSQISVWFYQSQAENCKTFIGLVSAMWGLVQWWEYETLCSGT